MSVAALMLVKDEADIIGPILRHLIGEVDHVFVADNRSTDGTLLQLREFADAHGRLTISTDNEVGYRQAEKTSALARAAFERGYDWVVPCDADEFWYSPFGRIGDVLDEISREALFVRAPLYNHITTDEDDPAELDPLIRIGWRFLEPGEMVKVACRTSPDLEIGMGNHEAVTTGRVHSERTPSLSGELAIRHFPWRSPEQFLSKIRNGARAYAAAPDLGEQYGEHWKMFGMPEDAGFEERVRNWFDLWGFYSDPRGPRGATELIYDPAPIATYESSPT